MAIDFQIVAHGSVDYERAVALRNDILRKPLGMAFSPEELEQEKDKMHVAGFMGGAVCATAMLVPQGTACRMQRVAVKAGLQSQGIGGQLLKFCEAQARRQGFSEIYCHARHTAMNFYLKHQFIPEGEPFDEIGIPHLRMRKRLA
jgi:predicted GNAT family N-acyltransferase